MSRRGYTIHGTLFELPVRYEVMKTADHDGGGAVGYAGYGAECSCFDRALGGRVMVKKVKGPVEGKTVRELRLLTRLRQYAVARVLNCFQSEDGGRDVYFVTPEYDATLQTVLRSDQILTRQHIKVMSFQLLEALRYLHETAITVVDLNPSTIFCNVDCSVRIGALGEVIHADHASPPTPPPPSYSSWYKSPEVLLAAPSITPSTDIWSLGTIISEMLYRHPLWPAQSNVEQIQAISDVLGVHRPSGLGTKVRDHELRSATYLDFLGDSRDAETVKKYVLASGPKLPVPLRNILPGAGKFLCDFLGRMLCFAPGDRESAASLLSHPYFDNLIPREITVKKNPEQDLGAVFDQKSQSLTEVEPNSPADLAGASQYVGYKVVKIDGVSVSPPPAQVNHPPMPLHSIGKGKAVTVLKFGDIIEPHLHSSEWVGDSGEDLEERVKEDICYLRDSN